MQLLRNPGRQFGVGGSKIGGKEAGRLNGGNKIAQGVTYAYRDAGEDRTERTASPALSYHISGANVSRLPDLALFHMTSL
jgi:hypothetical protein